MSPLVSILPTMLALVPVSGADPSFETPDAISAMRGTMVALPQSFIEDEKGFFMLGDGLAACLETGRIRWILSGEEHTGTKNTGAAETDARRSVITIEPVGARENVAPAGEEELPGLVSWFHGEPSQWKAGRRTFRSVRYTELWAGVDLILEAQDQTLKGTYVVAPGADPTAVCLRHQGADSVTVDAEGRLIARTPAGDLVDAAPVAWQEIQGRRHDVSVTFQLEPGPNGSVDVSFQLGAHDPSVELRIDPAVIVQAGFLGGAQDDHAIALDVDPNGNVYVCGNTHSSEATFPVLVGPKLVFEGGTAGDAFVAKLDPTGKSLLYAGFIGGNDSDWARCLAVDSLGRAYVGGHTKSDENSGFPLVAGPSLNFSGSNDGWVARVSADGSSLDYCGYIGGNADDRVFGIDVDSSFRSYVVGRFTSLSNTLPLKVGPRLLPPGGSTDSFVGRLSANGTSFDYSTLR